MKLPDLELYDFHCDTALSCLRNGVSLTDPNNGLHISLGRELPYKRFVQTLAVFSSPSLSNDEGWETFLKAAELIKAQSAGFPTNFGWILAVEGGNILNNDLSRLDRMAELGVKFLTLVWGGWGCIGGAHSDPEGRGLTDFGAAVVRRCYELGIIPDVSHSSDKSFWMTSEIAGELGGTLIATHSNSRSICPHKRNLTDAQFTRIVNLGGVAGLNFCRNFIVANGDSVPCAIDDIVPHIERFISLGGEDSVVMGADLDGTSPLPLASGHKNAPEIIGAEELYLLADRLLQLNYSEKQVRKIFSENAKAFLKRNDINEQILH